MSGSSGSCSVHHSELHRGRSEAKEYHPTSCYADRSVRVRQ